MQETSQPIRYRWQWLPLIGILTGVAFLGALLIQRLGQVSMPTSATLIPTVGALVDAEALGLGFKTPGSWKMPVERDAHSFVISPTGSTDTGVTAGPFVYVVIDAVNVFKDRLNLRTDLSDPVQLLNAVIEATNNDAARFDAAATFRGAQYPAAVSHGYQRGSGQLLVLMRASDGRWIYIGAQAPSAQFSFLEQTVFNPVIASITLKSR